jgi:hypothetical protein
VDFSRQEKREGAVKRVYSRVYGAMRRVRALESEAVRKLEPNQLAAAISGEQRPWQ